MSGALQKEAVYAAYCESLASISTWVYTLARNTVIDYFRTKKTFAEVPEALAAAETIEDMLMQRDKLQALCGALKTLDQRSRDLILLRYYRGMTLKDIAQRLGVSYSYVKLLHSTALADLRKRLEKENGIIVIK